MSSTTERGAWLALLLALGCKPGVGDNCVCEGECRGGLVCAQGGQILEHGLCVTTQAMSTEPGRCIEQENVPEGTTSLGTPPDKHDVGSKRDFEPGMPVPADDSAGSSISASASESSSAASSSSGDAASSSESSSSGAASSSGAP
jgi:hypothetical protein